MKTKNTILIVDDDFAHRTMLKTLIAGWGYEVREADDGAAAVEAVHKDPFDLILMDIRMVRVSGLEALEEIRRFNPALPVILMTAYASVETAVEALKKGPTTTSQSLSTSTSCGSPWSGPWSTRICGRRTGRCGKVSARVSTAETSSAAAPP